MSNNFEPLRKKIQEIEKFLTSDKPLRIIKVEGLNHFQKSFTNQGFTDKTLKKWPARKVAEMKKFLSEADVLPNIKWLPSTAVHPRELHKPFYNRIWPGVSLFWQEHRLGDLWGCQCDWEATDEEPTGNSGI